ncbi:hypothetical protein MINS_31480 [Mycolicibacterium insubricum]|jgi:hypothetical protein|uniref:Uncharacterized protein n=1 Tax=Mycolicibacterium insubricum TaxID=444597 RepID=A0A1X0D5C7_9MYCO|nr:DUF2561 family protein [Mycolicibacterium insubricum]MCB9441303.1 DUF2561 family protein [Mycolicibacterium sp.]MCV7084061.1 DUF2561 family protein [Mycolicibacterium insubricum]ORA67382.1 hypothetical protein BST26_15720 [Mycolicibacterium insubricum]BBZ67719.1 hypothetical protein MINS_31480 [Mycolicibacterium insubricum]
MADPSPLDRFTKSPENTDRVFVAAASTVWLIALALAVLAIISLVRLGSGPQVHSGGEASSGSTWWLWLIIGVSAAIIAGAMPLLVRARQAAQSAPSRRAVSKPAVRRAVDRYPPEFSTSVPQNRIPAAALDRLWLRGGLGVLTATGVAMGAVALATYLIAEGNDTGAYISFGVAALVSLGMIAIPEVFLKELKDRLAESDAVHAA